MHPKLTPPPKIQWFEGDATNNQPCCPLRKTLLVLQQSGYHHHPHLHALTYKILLQERWSAGTSWHCPCWSSWCSFLCSRGLCSWSRAAPPWRRRWGSKKPKPWWCCSRRLRKDLWYRWQSQFLERQERIAFSHCKFEAKKREKELVIASTTVCLRQLCRRNTHPPKCLQHGHFLWL